PAQEQRTVPAGLDGRLHGHPLLLAAVEAPEVERARGTGEDRCCNALGVGCVDANPRSCLRVEDLAESAAAVLRVDAEPRAPTEPRSPRSRTFGRAPVCGSHPR